MQQLTCLFTQNKTTTALQTTHTAPVVHQDEPKDVILSVVDADWLAKLVAGANKERHFQFHVQNAAWAKHWRLGCTQTAELSSV